MFFQTCSAPRHTKLKYFGFGHYFPTIFRGIILIILDLRNSPGNNNAQDEFTNKYNTAPNLIVAKRKRFLSASLLCNPIRTSCDK